MTIYLDKDFCCHVKNNTGEYTAVETAFFDGKCAAYIEGYRYIPEGETWTSPNGITFTGLMVAPITKHSILASVQSLYEEMNAAAVKEERIVALEKANATLREENAMLLECILEMSEIVYA